MLPAEVLHHIYFSCCKCNTDLNDIAIRALNSLDTHILSAAEALQMDKNTLDFTALVFFSLSL